MKTTLVTICNGRIESEIIDRLSLDPIGYNCYLTSTKLIDVQNYLYGNCGMSMYDVICTKLDKLTAETLNR